MHRDNLNANWTTVCELDDIVPNTGVCALLNGEAVAVFRLNDSEQRVFAVSNFDPNSNASVLSRGLIGNLGERIVVASPIYKHHFDLQTGECLEAPEHSIATYPARIENGKVLVGA
ncbi:nitrite reductase small subunit NirD [Pseudoduganella ginsengisoli]|uniref:Nitrite reductase small subunit NirD n=1 Tax=Pseudoduganella ginsengisoli TaxID=1462440 RepID=A0A6L6PVE0_9BURK|nr:nitrite reductase small subunit NirD [Pseudoduganella ginsengisoli]MTW01196.1 nitrite reductase small subunit NirD [Pseudoduganella ginsengisoli]